MRLERNWLWFVLPLNVAAVSALLFVPSATAYDPSPAAVETVYVERDRPANALVDPDGRKIRNLYVFDENGQPLTEVYVYDQKGRAVVLPRKVCRGKGDGSWVGRSRPGDNRFPQPDVRMRHDPETGGLACRAEPGVPFTVAVPSDPRQPESTPSPEPTGTLSPSPAGK